MSASTESHHGKARKATAAVAASVLTLSGTAAFASDVAIQPSPGQSSETPSANRQLAAAVLSPMLTAFDVPIIDRSESAQTALTVLGLINPSSPAGTGTQPTSGVGGTTVVGNFSARFTPTTLFRTSLTNG